MVPQNPGIKFDKSLLKNCYINTSLVNQRAQKLTGSRAFKKEWQVAWTLKALTCIDLTTLSGDDASCNVEQLCLKAENPLGNELIKVLNKFGVSDEFAKSIKCGAVCVYPMQVACAVRTLEKLHSNLPVASVATGFPSGQYHLKTRLEEIRLCVADGAKEIDIVISRQKALEGDWEGLYDELQQMKEACGTAHMKAILAVGELGSLSNVYKASIVAMMAGSDFIKTSTGKESVNATIPVGLVMCRAIREYYKLTGHIVGLKPAGGIRTTKDAISWLVLVKEELGSQWLNNSLFRIGASGLLKDIEKQLYYAGTGQYAADYEFTPGSLY